MHYTLKLLAVGMFGAGLIMAPVAYADDKQPAQDAAEQEVEGSRANMKEWAEEKQEELNGGMKKTTEGLNKQGEDAAK